MQVYNNTFLSLSLFILLVPFVFPVAFAYLYEFLFIYSFGILVDPATVYVCTYLIHVNRMSSSSAPPSKGGGKVASKRHLHPYMPYSTAHTGAFALWAEKWYVRIISLAIVILVTAVYIVIYPAILLITLGVDIARYSKYVQIS